MYLHALNICLLLVIKRLILLISLICTITVALYLTVVKVIASLYIALHSFYHSLVNKDEYRHRVGALSVDGRCLCPSLCHVPCIKSRTEGPSKVKIGEKEAHDTSDP